MKKVWGMIFGRFLPAAAILLLAGCMLSGGDTFYGSAQVGGGGEDFPNTVNRLGKIAAADVNSAADWKQVQNLELPEIPAIRLDSLRVDPPLFKQAASGLGKIAASEECLPAFWTWDITELLRQRRIRKITCSADSVAVRRDTLFYYYAGGDLPATQEFEAKPDSFMSLVGSNGSITYTGQDKVQYYRCSNLDTLGGLDYGDFVTVQYGAGRQTATFQRYEIYGPDGAYLDPKAAPEEFEYTRVNAAGDTLEWKRMRDADGDRKFWGAAGTGLVTFERLVSEPDNEPATARLALVMKARLTHDAVNGDNLKRMYYKDARVLRNGRVTGFSFFGTASDSVLRAMDTAAVTSDTVFAATDSMKTFHGVYTLKLGADPDSMSTHSLLGFGIDKAWRRGPLRSSVTSFKPAKPVPSNQSGFSGVMTSAGAYANGDSVFTTGTIDSTGIELEYRGVKSGKEEAFKLLYDLNGNVVGSPVPVTRGSAKRARP